MCSSAIPDEQFPLSPPPHGPTRPPLGNLPSNDLHSPLPPPPNLIKMSHVIVDQILGMYIHVHNTAPCWESPADHSSLKTVLFLCPWMDKPSPRATSPLNLPHRPPSPPDSANTRTTDMLSPTDPAYLSPNPNLDCTPGTSEHLCNQHPIYNHTT